MAGSKKVIKGSTLKFRLFVPTSKKYQLLESGVTGTGTAQDLLTATCQFAAKSAAGDLIYIIDPIMGTVTGGYLDFTVTDEILATVTPATLAAEVLWAKGGETYRFQFSLEVSERVIDDPTAPAAETETQIENFAGSAGVAIAISDQGTKVYFPMIQAVGSHHGKIGDIEIDIDSVTQFTVRNSGSSRGEFLWRLRK